MRLSFGRWDENWIAASSLRQWRRGGQSSLEKSRLGVRLNLFVVCVNVLFTKLVHIVLGNGDGGSRVCRLRLSVAQGIDRYRCFGR